MADEIAATPIAVPATSDFDSVPSASALEAAAIEPKIIAEIEAPKVAPTPLEMPAVVEAPKLAAGPVQMDAPAAEIKATAAELGASPRARIAAGAAAISSVVNTRRRRYALLAATVVFAAGLGIVAGALGVYGFMQLGAAPAQATIAMSASEKTAALQSTVARMQTELAAVRTSIEASTRATNAQFTKITERFDRIDKAQTERAAKFTKAVDTLERLEKRADAAPARETTGSVPAPQPVAATPAPIPLPPQPPQQAQQSQQQQVIEGWVVRNVYRGTAIVQNRRIGTIDVEPGDVLPGVGRVESIKKQDGRWVVVTSRGLITSMR
jgi:hypothetical protein